VPDGSAPGGSGGGSGNGADGRSDSGPEAPPDGASLGAALEHMTGPRRGSVTWLSAPDLDVTLDAGCFLHLSETQPGARPKDLVARLHRVSAGYEIEAPRERAVWVNGQRVSSARLAHGQTIEFGETGPLCRCRFFSEHSPVRNSVADILSDIATYYRVSRKPLVSRSVLACGALFGRLSRETGLLFKVTVLLAIAAFALLALQQRQLNTLLRQELASASSQLDYVAAALSRAQQEALRPGDLTSLREQLEQQLTSNVTRLEDLELRSTANRRVITRANASVAFLQGVFGFRERDGSRMLRHVVNAAGAPLITPRGQPLLSLDGSGPEVEIQFTGTGFIVGGKGLMITNRHVALPWEEDGSVQGAGFEGLQPVMMRFIAYLPGRSEPLEMSLVRASDSADLAILRYEDEGEEMSGLSLAEAPPALGDEVIVMGYPTGLRSMLAQSGAAFLARLQQNEDTGFWNIAARLAADGFIAPLASRGIVGQVTASTVVYDAETTYGGSGGPVLDINGKVIAVNAAILPEYGGSNLGVPVRELRALIAEAGLQSGL
jgi:serine protease Do